MNDNTIGVTRYYRTDIRTAWANYKCIRNNNGLWDVFFVADYVPSEDLYGFASNIQELFEKIQAHTIAWTAALHATKPNIFKNNPQPQ